MQRVFNITPDRSLAPSFVATACLRPLHRVREQGGQSNPPQIGKARPVTLHTGTDDSEPKANPRASLGRSLPRAAPAPGQQGGFEKMCFLLVPVPGFLRLDHLRHLQQVSQDLKQPGKPEQRDV